MIITNNFNSFMATPSLIQYKFEHNMPLQEQINSFISTGVSKSAINVLLYMYLFSEIYVHVPQHAIS